VRSTSQKDTYRTPREFGGVWLATSSLKRWDLNRYLPWLKQNDEGVSWRDIIKILVISRFYSPSSELHIAEHLYEHSAMEDFFGIPAQTGI